MYRDLDPNARYQMTLTASRVLGTTWRHWRSVDPIALTRSAPAATVATSLVAAAGETGPREVRHGSAPAPKVYRPGNSQAKGPQRIGLSGE
jgi:hypothetical protein